MRRLEGGDWKSASTGNSLVAYPTSSTVLKTSGVGDCSAEFNPINRKFTGGIFSVLAKSFVLSWEYSVVLRHECQSLKDLWSYS